MRLSHINVLVSSLLGVALLACTPDPSQYDPLQYARQTQRARVINVEAGIPPQCYTQTGATRNPCWVCHTSANGENQADDWPLQERYDFSEFALTNHWRNLFVDWGDAIARQSDAQIQRWIAQDNYTPLRRALGRPQTTPFLYPTTLFERLQAQQARENSQFKGWRLDFDYARGVDAQGFARDGSGWRALTYKPFPGTFWPTNGSVNDVLIRLPDVLQRDAKGRYSQAIYQINLAITAAAVGNPDARAYVTEPLDETAAARDLDGDGRIGGSITTLRGLPRHYVGAAHSLPVVRGQYPAGTELLHTLHYLDPRDPDFKATRIKEVRYARKGQVLTRASIQKHYADDAREQLTGGRPHYAGNAFTGLSNDFDWTYQGWIEDEQGRLRLQTREEHLACMGCHTGLGITVDGSFALPRQLPGARGWGMQTLRGQRDTAQIGHPLPEYQLYLQRARAGDEFAANTEMLDRFFDGDGLRQRAYEDAVNSTEGLAALLLPSPARALQLNKAYRALVQTQTFIQGRDAVLQPITTVHQKLVNDDTGLAASEQVFKDARLWLAPLPP